MKRAGAFTTPFGPALAVVDVDGALCELSLSGRLETEEFVRDNSAVHDVAKQVREYFDGERRDFDLLLAPDGTDFQQAVWEELVKIPYGTTISYLTLAQRVGRPKASRAHSCCVECETSVNTIVMVGIGQVSSLDTVIRSRPEVCRWQSAPPRSAP